MCLSERVFLPTFPTSPARFGTHAALCHQGFPNLPNLPNLLPSRVRGRACRRMHTQARARAHAHLTTFTLGRLVRLGTVRRHKGSRVPNLCLTSPRLGT
jgi:hypothetical protein